MINLSNDIFFSIIIPVYNGAGTISKTISSVLKQKYKKWELIIVDDGSTDNTFDTINLFQDDRIKYIRQENQGTFLARYNGIKRSKGNYLIFLDADDHIVENALEKIFDIIVKDKHVELIQYNINEKEKYNQELYYDKFIKSTRFNSMCTKCIKKDLFNELELNVKDYQNLTMNEDRLLVAKIIKKTNNVAFLTETLYLYEDNSTSITNNISLSSVISHIRASERIIEIFKNNKNNNDYVKIYNIEMMTIMKIIIINSNLKEFKSMFEYFFESTLFKNYKLIKKRIKYKIIYRLFLKKRFFCIKIIEYFRRKLKKIKLL